MIPVGWDLRDLPWGWSAVTQDLVGDSGPWAWSIPLTWQALAEPGGPWVPPAEPPARAEENFESAHGRAIADWTPLLTVTLGALGWARPDLGARRWLDAGLPMDGAALTVLHRWWGANVGALEVWTATGGSLPSIANHVGDVVGGRRTADWSPDAALRVGPPSWGWVTDGGYDGLHLGHVTGHLCDGGRQPGPRLLRDSDAGRAVLLLNGYSGWYAALARVGADLPPLPGDRSWRVDVVVRPLGWLGTYRRSRLTGRWFTGRHRWHVLGWNGPVAAAA